MKLKTGLSIDEIKVSSNPDQNDGHPRLSEIIHSTVIRLDSHFVPKYLYCSHLTQEDARFHNTTYGSILFAAEEVKTIWNGIHFYNKKCNDYEMAGSTYS